ncbi:MAG: formylglycine-generating enzyme family protein [Jatrophihabitans sp.]
MLVDQRNFSMLEFAGRRLTLGGPPAASQPADADPGLDQAIEVEIDAFSLADRCVSAGDFYAFLSEVSGGGLDHTQIDCIDPCFIVHRAGGFALRPGCADFPMIQISFWAAAAYCNWLSRVEGLAAVYDVAARAADLDLDGYRLPTEAEWEAACWQGHPDGALPAPDRCNSADAGPTCRALRAGAAGAGNFVPGQPGPVPVAALPADAAGLYGMLGNLREWCQDRYASYSAAGYSSASHSSSASGGVLPLRNPRGASRGAFRVVRGGSFIDPAAGLGPASRLAAFEDTRCEVYGFRVARAR